MRISLLSLLVAIGFQASAASTVGDYLVQVAPNVVESTQATLQTRLPQGSSVENLGLAGWLRVTIPQNQVSSFSTNTILRQAGVLHLQPNYKLKLYDTWSVKNPAQRAALLQKINADGGLNAGDVPPDNPAIPANGSGGSGSDPLFSNQWGMNQLGVKEAWNQTKGSPEMVVAVIDTGVDYTHEDLVDNMWRNPGETGRDSQGRDKASNGIDDDGNGYVDDIIGWDFVSNDNKPYDLIVSLFDMLFGGGNPGHGTHCAGYVAARADNGKGVAGVAPNVKIMVLRFLSEKGQGTTADAVKAVRYAIDNGARVLSNSWGSEGEDPQDPDNKALRDVIRYSEEKGALFVAAAGNGHQGKGYDNDNDSKPAYPASYPDDIIISVAAIDEAGQLGSFSNWGARGVDVGAPGVKVFSTTVDGNYSDTVINMPELGLVATWDGTSMAAPHVSGAAALYWSKHPTKSWMEVKQAILGSVKKTSVLGSKTVSGGQLDVSSLMRF